MKKSKRVELNSEDIERVVSMAQEERKPFEVVKEEFGISENEVTKIIEDMEEGTMLTISQIDTLRYVCGFPKKRRANPVLSAIAEDFSNIFGGKQ